MRNSCHFLSTGGSDGEGDHPTEAGRAPGGAGAEGLRPDETRQRSGSAVIVRSGNTPEALYSNLGPSVTRFREVLPYGRKIISWATFFSINFYSVGQFLGQIFTHYNFLEDLGDFLFQPFGYTGLT